MIWAPLDNYLVMVSAANFYASDLFVGILPTAALVVSIAGVLTTYLVSTPRRQLLYRLESCTSLLVASPNARKEIRVLHHDRELADPYILKVRLASRGRQDIESTAFDQGRPIILDLGVEIVAHLPEEASERLPKMEFAGKQLRVGPDLINRHRHMTFTLLADGPDAQLTCEAHLANVRVRKEPSEDSVRRAISRIFTPIEAGCVVIAFTILFVGTNSSGNISTAALVGFFTFLAISGITLFSERLALRWFLR